MYAWRARVGIVNPTLATVAVGVVPPERSGMASGTNNTFRQVGIATGIAAFGALFENRISAHLTSALGHDPGHGVVAGVASGSFPPAFAEPAREAFVNGLHSLLFAAAIVAFVGAALSAFLLRGFEAHGTSAQARPAPSAEG